MKRAGLITGILVAAALLVLPDGPAVESDSSDAASNALVSPDSLVRWILSGNQRYLLVDVRTEEAFARHAIKTAVPIPAPTLDEATVRSLPRHRRIILYGEDTDDALAAWRVVRSLREDVYVLDGGVAAWDRRILDPRTPRPDADEAAWADYRRNVAVAAYLQGRGAGADTLVRRAVRPVLRPRAPMPTDEGC